MKEPIKILIIVRGGVVTDVACSLATPGAVEVHVADYDDEAQDEQEVDDARDEFMGDYASNWIL